ncbi:MULTISPECIES: hypothetical protein [unclassified Streptomyces]|uniref:hypothetical protein n=1 Tax=unclassified Streptomyces TaxID=2593676 RepID=UPI002257C493|nr:MULTISPECIES: hypothetical protein [unclassified Streptomyces]MCX4881004.1 hypothetical protein [Streptomyces sp. NBC_00847]MCX5048404.1 hypothetical protein [Streptomyces sp. NBC_00474]MCX5056861.1 hypothetical protein [Streptomyces sp. NBC_00452]MCX5246222.1 hypothetical protein [Streptomyces sp. NBC_00201]MCX5287953.1 hypothetical protein [Streptomyces sp. NBC_00183]
METSQSVVPRTPSTTVAHAPTPERSEPPLTGGACDLVTVPTRQGLEAVDILRRGTGDAVGPVLHDDGCTTLGFLVPPGTAAAWDVPGSTCTETDGRGLRLNPEPPVEGSDWLLPPGEADLATDPAVLRAALGEAARIIKAADSCR